MSPLISTFPHIFPTSTFAFPSQSFLYYPIPHRNANTHYPYLRHEPETKKDPNIRIFGQMVKPY